MKTIDIYEYMAVLKEILAMDRDVNLRVSGWSMTPFLADKRDIIIISPKTETLKRGDMVFYQRKNGQYIMHRIHHIDENGALYIVGDAHTEIEGPVDAQQVFGVVKKVIRKGKLIDEKDFWWKFFEKVWIRMVPLRPVFRKAYEWLKKDKESRNE